MQRIRTHLGDELVRVAVIQVLVLLAHGLQDVQVLLFRQEVEVLHSVPFLVHGRTGLDHHVPLVVDDLVELLGGQAQQVADLVRKTAEIPDVGHRHHQLDVAHAFTAHLLLGHFHTAAVAHDPFVTDALVLAAVALEVLHRTEDALAEEAITLRLVGPVVDRLRLDHLTVAALEDLLGAGQADDDLVEVAVQLHFLLHVLALLASVRRSVAHRVDHSRETFRARPRSSWSSTLNDSGIPGVGRGSPFTMAS